MIDAGGRKFVFVLSGDASGVRTASRDAQGSLREVADTTTALDRAQQGAANSSAGLLGSLGRLGLGVIGLHQVTQAAISGAQALMQAQINADRLQMQLAAGAGAAAAGREIDYVREVSNRLGLQLDSTAISYARFVAAARGTSLEGKSVRDIFESVAKSAAVMGLSTDETQGALRALEQMMSKGVVQAEELRGQLGDRLPGALQIAARALGVTTKELQAMVERGEVLAADFLPRFAAQLDKEVGAGADKAADTMGAAVNRMGNAWEQLKQDLAATGIGDAMKSQLAVATDGLNAVGEAMRRAKQEGGGFMSQIASGTGQLLLFLNPFNAISYSARSLSGELQQAREKLADLRHELVVRPGNIFLGPAIKETEELIARLERARELRAGLVDQSSAETARLASYEKNARSGEEAAGRRREALAKVTSELTRQNDKLVQSLKVLGESFQAGDMQRPDYDRMVALAYAEHGPKRAKPDKSLLTGQVYETPAMAFARFERAQQPQVEEAYRRGQLADEQRAREQREREAKHYEQRLDQADRFADHMTGLSAQLDARTIADGQARNQAVLAIERAQLTSRLDALKLNAQDRERVEDEIARYLVAREAQLTDELKPEWQRRLEQWQDQTQLMRDSYDGFMQGFVDEGERAFSEFLRTGKLNTRSLVNFMADEFARLVYRRHLAGYAAQGADWLLGLMGIGAGALNIDAGGFGIGSGRTDGMVGLPTRGGAATGTNFVQRDMLTILHKGEAVIPRAFNPWADGAGAAAGAGPQPVVQHITYNVPPGHSPAAYAGALEANNQRLKYEIAADMARPGRVLQRAASKARS